MHQSNGSQTRVRRINTYKACPQGTGSKAFVKEIKHLQVRSKLDSSGGIIDRPKINRLSDKNFERLMYLKSNSYVKDYYK